ncbi:hypothetical protein BGZ79_003614, partial [Entomortierella chlamydospora]
DDKALLKQSAETLSVNKRNAIIVRSGEREIVQSVLDKVKKWKPPTPTPAGSSTGKQKGNPKGQHPNKGKKPYQKKSLFAFAMLLCSNFLKSSFRPTATTLACAFNATPPRFILSRMSSATSNSEQQQQQQQQQQEQQQQTPTDSHDTQPDFHKPVLTLPAPADVASDGSTNQLEVNGQDLKLDLLGPVVVNEDGTMSRIDNWHEMAEIEKANVRRILLKRNAQRLAKLRAEHKLQDDQEQQQ